MPDKDTEESIKLLNEAGLQISGISDEYEKEKLKGKMFAKILKRRYGRSFISAVFDWNGTTKHIAQNGKNEPPQQGNIWDKVNDDDLPF